MMSVSEIHGVLKKMVNNIDVGRNLKCSYKKLLLFFPKYAIVKTYDSFHSVNVDTSF